MDQQPPIHESSVKPGAGGAVWYLGAAINATNTFSPPKVVGAMRRVCQAGLVLLTISTIVAADDLRPVAAAALSIEDNGQQLTIRRGAQQLATYVYQHDQIRRPFFANVKTTTGTQVTRNFPPLEGTDATDHQSMHPGIWLAFGDLSGEDFWRNKGRVVHAGFSAKPTGGVGRADFVENKLYLRGDGEVVCEEVFACTVRELPQGILIGWDSTFSSDREFYFGDQEEMGLGIRVATAISEVSGGRIRDSEGRSGAKQVWSNSSAWCDYSGQIGDEAIGLTILCHGDNFRGSWMHARDYGVIAANAFGRQAMQKGPRDQTIVQPGETLRLRYGIFAHSDRPDLDAVFQQYQSVAGQK